MRRILIIDSSLQGVLIGIASQAHGVGAWEIVSSKHYENPQAAAASLPEVCASVLRDVGVPLDELNDVLVGIGPGSFTGIKIGLSFVYGLKRAKPELALWGVSALRGLALTAGGDSLWILPATQYSGYFARLEGGQVSLGAIETDNAGNFMLGSSMTSSKDWPRELVILGSWPGFRHFCGENNISFREHAISELSGLIFEGLLQDFVAGSSQVSGRLPEPMYIRKSAPEEKLERALLDAQ